MKFVTVVTVILFAGSLGLNGYLLTKDRDQNIVTLVTDGDTFELKNGDRIRLLGVDAPEKGRCGYEEAKQRLTELVLNKQVVIKEEKKWEEHGRRNGLVYLGDTLLNIEMVKTGYVRINYDKNSQNELFKSTWENASVKCRHLEPVDSKCVIKGNIGDKDGKKVYYLPKCRHYNLSIVDMAKGENFFCSEVEASAAGFHLSPDCLR